MESNRTFFFKVTCLLLNCLFSQVGQADGDVCGEDRSVFNLPEPSIKNTKVTPWATNYYTKFLERSNFGPYPLLDLAGNRLGPTLDEEEWCSAAFEGAVRIKIENGEAKTYTYHGLGSYDQVDCKGGYARYPSTKRVRYRLSPYEFGEGVNDYILIPYRSIAVASREFAYGTVLFVPAAKGIPVTLPNGCVISHDGYFFAADTGAAMQRDSGRAGREHHVDIFTGIDKDKHSQIPIVSDTPEVRFEAWVVSDPEKKAFLKKIHSR